MAVADHGLLDLERRVLGNRQACVHRGADRRAARLAERERRCGIDVDEDFLQRDLLRPVLHDDFAQVLENDFQPVRQAGVSGFDATAGDVGEPAAVFLDYPEPGDAQTRVDAKNPQGWTGHCPAL
jgi:hypothetical protein